MLINEITFDLSRVTGFSLTVAIVGYVIVFGALVLLFFVYNMMPKVINFITRRKLRKEGKCDDCEVLNVSGDVAAAISMALYLQLDLHDEESDVITIKRISKQYTPWSSKIYSTNSYFR